MENINDFISFENHQQRSLKSIQESSDQIIDLWKCYGFGSMLNGYLRAINPKNI